MQKARLSGLGVATQLATFMAGGTVTNTLTATGSASTDALLVTDDINIFTTTASSTGAILPPGNGTVPVLGAGDAIVIANHGANTLKVYPPAGFKLNNGTATTGSLNVATLKTGIFFCIDGSNWTGIVGA